MKITKFEVKNFKGIKNCSIEIPTPGSHSIVPLIGLNESGKTTILEAISKFISKDDGISSLFKHEAPPSEETEDEDVQQFLSLVPKDQKSNFSDEISITATISIDPGDINDIVISIKEETGITIEEESFPTIVRFQTYFQFENSNFKTRGNYAFLDFKYKSKGGRKFKTISEERRLKSPKSDWVSAYLKCRKQIIARLPQICYFPTFLFDFPEKIYLADHPDESEQNKLFRRVIQDAFDSEGSGLKVEAHIVDRIRSQDSLDSWETSWTEYLLSHQKEPVDHSLKKLGLHISKTVFGSWNKIFEQKIKGKNLEIELDIDREKDGIPFLKFVIFDGPTKYSLSDRSLGFRWFFSFLLFTEFRGARTDNAGTIFLFDEPASNLHAKAQIQLLESFPKISQHFSSIIYSTHSMYLINPLHLENAYIIENKALNIDDETYEYDFSNNETNVLSSKYRTFVGSTPEKGSYFQPVIDHLKSVQSPLSLPTNAIIFEGKTDFYLFSYFLRKYKIKDINVFPSSGATTMDTLISLALGYGKKFLIVLDDDAAGKKAAQKYNEQYNLQNKAVTFGDIDPSFNKFKLEHFLDEEDYNKIKSSLHIEKVTKKHIAIFFAEQCSTLSFDLSAPSVEKLTKLVGDIKIIMKKI